MTESRDTFAPDRASPPGETLLDLIEERGWTQAELADRLGYTTKHVSLLINGKVALTVEAATRLSRVLGSTMDFWLSREANYQKHLARLEADKLHAIWTPWLDKLPVRELMSVGALPTQRIDVRNKPGLVDACLRFFGVASPDDWRKHYGGMQVAFRRNRVEQSDVGAISAWLRLGEQAAERIDGPKYNEAEFERALARIRTLTREAPETFEPKMLQWLHDAGVILVLVPAIPRAHVSGVARWLSPTRPLIQLSLMGKTNERFWFTFFHEAAHILLHGVGKDAKRFIFLDDGDGDRKKNRQEQEADRWAADFLIPEADASELPTLRSADAVNVFARRIGVHPGIVVGRLQHEELVDYSRMNELKQRFRFRDAS